MLQHGLLKPITDSINSVVSTSVKGEEFGSAREALPSQEWGNSFPELVPR
jgi:hypothetical protein